MNLKHVLPHVGTPELRQRIQEEIDEQAHDLPLEICCRHGGWPEPDTLSVGDIPDPIVDA